MPNIRGEILDADTRTLLAALNLTDMQDARIRAHIGRQVNEDGSPATPDQVRDEIYRYLRGLALRDAIRETKDRTATANAVLEAEGW